MWAIVFVCTGTWHTYQGAVVHFVRTRILHMLVLRECAERNALSAVRRKNHRAERSEWRDFLLLPRWCVSCAFSFIVSAVVFALLDSIGALVRCACWRDARAIKKKWILQLKNGWSTSWWALERSHRIQGFRLLSGFNINVFCFSSLSIALFSSGENRTPFGVNWIVSIHT